MDPARVSGAAFHRHPVDDRRGTVLPRDLDRHQRRPVLSERAWRRFHDVHRRVGQRATSERKGPLGKHYPFPCCIHEGDTPSFLGLINNGLASFMSPTYGGWGGRYVWRSLFRRDAPVVDAGWRFVPGPRQLARYGRRHRRPAAHGDQATIWRWRTAFQHDFAARMDWTVRTPRDANHNPVVVVNGQAGKAPMASSDRGMPFVLDARGHARSGRQQRSGTRGLYREAGTAFPIGRWCPVGLPRRLAARPAKAASHRRPKAVFPSQRRA